MAIVERGVWRLSSAACGDCRARRVAIVERGMNRRPAQARALSIEVELRMEERLAAADRAYRRRHPHGNQPPTIAVGVELSYVMAG
jgi:ABC-type Fe3+/spermidine/putrescine transport system ATPase subunit